jgi:hypothetical protein
MWAKAAIHAQAVLLTVLCLDSATMTFQTDNGNDWKLNSAMKAMSEENANMNGNGERITDTTIT